MARLQTRIRALARPIKVLRHLPFCFPSPLLLFQVQVGVEAQLGCPSACACINSSTCLRLCGGFKTGRSETRLGVGYHRAVARVDRRGVTKAFFADPVWICHRPGSTRVTVTAAEGELATISDAYLRGRYDITTAVPTPRTPPPSPLLPLPLLLPPPAPTPTELSASPAGPHPDPALLLLSPRLLL